MFSQKTRYYETLPGWEHRIADWFSPRNKLAKYRYDFGDDWKHIVKLEKILPRDEKGHYPVCIDGERACPPEDCGGDYGYANLLNILNNRRHEEHKTMMKWVGGKFDPEYFKPDKVVFDDPEERWQIAFR